MLCAKEWNKEYCEVFNSKRVINCLQMSRQTFVFVMYNFHKLTGELCMKSKKKLWGSPEKKWSGISFFLVNFLNF